MKFIRLAFSFLCLFSATAFAQTYGTINGNIATSISGGATSTANTVFDTRYNRNVAVQIGATSATTNSTLAVTFLRSLDGVTYETTAPWVFTLTLTSAGTFGMVTNIDVGASGYLKLTTAVAGATVPLTGTAVTVALKPGNWPMAAPEDLGEQAAIMLEGILLSEASLRCSFEWNGDSYPCAAGPIKGGKRLDEGGYRLSSKLSIKVRVSLFPSGAGTPQEKQTILFKKNTSAEPLKLRIDSVTDWWGAVLQLDCENPNKSA